MQLVLIPFTVVFLRNESARLQPPDPNDYSGKLADYRFPHIDVACAPYGRFGHYKVTSLRTMLFNPPLDEVPRLLAVKAGCSLALRYPNYECRAWFATRNQERASKYLGDRRVEGWQLMLSCDRTRQGLKSTKPCPRPFNIDLSSLVAVLGHTFEVAQLPRRLQCPGCGSHHHSLTWIAPKVPPAEPIPLKRAG